MSKVDLSKPFVTLIQQRHGERPELRLEATLQKANTTLTSYAESLGRTVNDLTLLEICLSNQALHPHLEQHVAALPQTKEYQGQNLSRIRKLVKGLAWEAVDAPDEDQPILIKELLPEHLRQVWFIFKRRLHRRRPVKGIGSWSAEYHTFRETLPLSAGGISLASSLLRVSSRFSISGTEDLLEDHAKEIISDLEEHHPPCRWQAHHAAFFEFRADAREFLRYAVEGPTRVRLDVDEVREPLRTQIRTYQERALRGFGADIQLVITARTRYRLELGRRSASMVKTHVGYLLLGLGYMALSGCDAPTDVRDILKLHPREVEADGITETELYNPFVEIYRVRELCRVSVCKGEGYDSGSFSLFIAAVAAVAAFNGFFHLRKLFLQTYRIGLDKSSRKKLKERKKETFDIPWLDGEIRRLGAEFHGIAASGSFMFPPGGAISRRARRDINLCLFYVALITLRFLGVRQQCIRDCVVGENVIFGAHKSVTFQWTEEETKNGKGLRHRLNMKDHGRIQGVLIDGAWTYYKKIYPHISRASDHAAPPDGAAGVQRIIAGQFFLRCGRHHCHPFQDASEFYAWFRDGARMYMNFAGRLGQDGINLNPHFLRALFGNWLRFVHGFSDEQTAKMAGDCVQTFEDFYITHPSIYDGTDAWTRRDREMGSVSRNGKRVITRE